MNKKFRDIHRAATTKRSGLVGAVRPWCPAGDGVTVRAMPWWAWLLLGWAAIGTACAVWWSPALANAETQDAARQISEDAPREDSHAGEGIRARANRCGTGTRG